VTEIASFVSHIAWANLFREWEKVVQNCIDMEGDCADLRIYYNTLAVASILLGMPILTGLEHPSDWLLIP
jgi:hypothetical protein